MLRLAGWEVKEPGSSDSVSVVPTREWLLAVINRINEDNLGNAFYANDCSTSLFFAICRTCSSFCFCLGRANQGKRVINMINGINEICAILDIRRLFYQYIWSGLIFFEPQKLEDSSLC